MPTIGNTRNGHCAASGTAASGIPIVRATSPGAEIREEAERRAAETALRRRYLAGEEASKPALPALTKFKQLAPNDPFKRHARPCAAARLFRLSSWPRASLSYHLPGAHKRRIARRNYLATFVEESAALKSGLKPREKVGNDDSDRAMGVERIERTVANEPAEELSAVVPIHHPKAGQSMHDHPSTWDRDSDQLAEELAAFALELSKNEEEEKLRRKTPEIHNLNINDTSVKLDEDFIYDTYIRVPIGKEKSGEQAMADAGLLVIEDEDQELWQTFVESDDDSEWDEEDPDSNGSR